MGLLKIENRYYMAAFNILVQWFGLPADGQGLFPCLSMNLACNQTKLAPIVNKDVCLFRH
jgi:hypothetical protein